MKSKENARGKGPTCQCRSPKRLRTYPWRRAWQPTPVFLPGESRGQRSLVGYSPWGCRVRYGWSELVCTQKEINNWWSFSSPRQGVHHFQPDKLLSSIGVSGHLSKLVFLQESNISRVSINIMSHHTFLLKRGHNTGCHFPCLVLRSFSVFLFFSLTLNSLGSWR